MHRIVVCAFWLMEFAATHAPISKEVEALPGSDKHLHLGAYCVLSALLMFWNGFRAAGEWRRVATVVLILAIYAAVDELLQPLFSRDAELLDWAADLAGAMLGAVVAFGTSRLFRARA